MSEWKEINSDSDIAEIMKACDDFHDSVIVSVNYRSGAYVDERQFMYFGFANDREMNVVFHSQGRTWQFELCFSGVRQAHLVGWDDYYGCDIMSAEILFFSHSIKRRGTTDRLIIWTDGDFDPSKEDDPTYRPDGTYIIAGSLKWRIIG